MQRERFIERVGRTIALHLEELFIIMYIVYVRVELLTTRRRRGWRDGGQARSHAHMHASSPTADSPLQSIDLPIPPKGQTNCNCNCNDEEALENREAIADNGRGYRCPK